MPATNIILIIIIIFAVTDSYIEDITSKITVVILISLETFFQLTVLSLGFFSVFETPGDPGDIIVEKKSNTETI